MRIGRWLRRNRPDKDLEQELQAHLAISARDRTLDQRDNPKMWGWSSLECILQDVRYALRGLRRNPVFAATAIVSLALGIGANTAIFSLINTVMFRLLPVRNPGELVELLQQYPGEPRGNGGWTWKSYLHFRAHNTVFSALVGTSIDNLLRLQTENGEPQRAVGEYVTANYFPTLGVKPAIGRFIGPTDRPSSEDGAVVSWDFWRNKLHQDPQVLGERMFVQNKPVIVIGVAPPSFVGLRIEARTDVWLPRNPSSQMGLTLLARLKPGATLAQTRAEMAVLYGFTIKERSAMSNDPQVRKLRLEIEPAGNGLATVRDRFGELLLVLMSVAGILLLIACVNIAGMLMARGASRERELAVRIGLGASRGRLVIQVLTESLLLSTSGTLIGTLVAYFDTTAFTRMLASGRLAEQIQLRIQPDLHVLSFAVGIAIATGLFFGMAPAVNAIRSTPALALRRTGGTGETRSKRFFGKSLVAVQVALSLLLLSIGGLFVCHLWNLEHTYLGFRRDHVLLITLDPTSSRYSGSRLSSDYLELLARLKQIHGVRSVSLCAPTPLSGAGANGFANVEGYQESPSDRHWITVSYISPKYFQTLESPLLAGRDFNPQDQLHPRVAIINETFARHYFAYRSPIGKHITLFHVTLDSEPKTYEIAGVAADAHYTGIRETQLSGVYLPAFHDGVVSANNLVLRTSGNPQEVVRDVRSEVRKVMQNVSIFRIITLSAQIDASILPERLTAMVAGLFAALGAILACIGIYGLLAYTVARRTNEIGIRMALGATAGNMRRMILGDTLAIVIAGFLIGTPMAILCRFLASSLVEALAVQTVVPIATGITIILFGAVLASYFPGRRAARVDPMEALRHE